MDGENVEFMNPFEVKFIHMRGVQKFGVQFPISTPRRIVHSEDITSARFNFVESHE
jgi:hypothetical protein